MLVFVAVLVGVGSPVLVLVGWLAATDCDFCGAAARRGAAPQGAGHRGEPAAPGAPKLTCSA